MAVIDNKMNTKVALMLRMEEINSEMLKLNTEMQHIIQRLKEIEQQEQKATAKEAAPKAPTTTAPIQPTAAKASDEDLPGLIPAPPASTTTPSDNDDSGSDDIPTTTQQTTSKLRTTTKSIPRSASQPIISTSGTKAKLSSTDDLPPPLIPAPPKPTTTKESTSTASTTTPMLDIPAAANTTAATLAMAKLLAAAKKSSSQPSNWATTSTTVDQAAGKLLAIAAKKRSSKTTTTTNNNNNNNTNPPPQQTTTTSTVAAKGGGDKSTTVTPPAAGKLMSTAGKKPSTRQSNSNNNNITTIQIPTTTNPPPQQAMTSVEKGGDVDKSTTATDATAAAAAAATTTTTTTKRKSHKKIKRSISQPIHQVEKEEAVKQSSTASLMGDESIGRSERSMVSLSERNSLTYVPTSLKSAFKRAPNYKWSITTQKFSGQLQFVTMGEQQLVEGKSIHKAIKKFKESRYKYYGLMYQTNMKSWDSKQQSYTLIMREGTTGLRPANVNSAKGWMTIMIHHYQHLPSFTDDNNNNNDPYQQILPPEYRDNYSHTPAMTTYNGKQLPPPILPGRGMGVGDIPTLKIIGDIDPCDIYQGKVGNCWLLSAISAIAEFDGAIKHIFRKTDRIDEKPLDDGSPNYYTISLWDIETWTEVDYVIDESLCSDPEGTGNLLSARMSEDGELWVPYLEKALAIHCGGWDEIKGGQCPHAWAILTGCIEQYTIERNQETGKFYCTAKFDTAKQTWVKHTNSPKKQKHRRWKVSWPKVGGGGAAGLELTSDELYQQMAAWDAANYIVGAATKASLDISTSRGMVDLHAYSVLDCYPQVAGTNIDLLTVRNPWGFGEMQVGKFDDNGPGWDEYPQIKNELRPEVKDDGLFYLTKEEFFRDFENVYVCCKSMTEFKED